MHINWLSFLHISLICNIQWRKLVRQRGSERRRKEQSMRARKLGRKGLRMWGRKEKERDRPSRVHAIKGRLDTSNASLNIKVTVVCRVLRAQWVLVLKGLKHLLKHRVTLAAELCTYVETTMADCVGKNAWSWEWRQVCAHSVKLTLVKLPYLLRSP